VRYPKECILKDCQEAVIRPLDKEDEAQLTEFYQQIPEDDRWYMRYDVADPQVLKKWIQRIEGDQVTSIVALCGSRIVGHGSLHLRNFGVTQHVGRIRISVLPDYRRQRLGTWLMLDLIQLALDKGLEEVRIDLVGGVEDAAIGGAKGLDFFKAGVLRDYAKDPDGQRHDLVIMVKHLHKGWSDF
jgi:L-amino acid N-acyltransferase YncA